MQEISFRQPDDWHLHLRDDDIMKTVLPFSAQHFNRAIVMPNLNPPITNSDQARDYKTRIVGNLPSGSDFEPLMTCYLTDETCPKDLIDGYNRFDFTAAKLYPANATTNSSKGVSDISKIYHILDAMEKARMPLLVHGETSPTDPKYTHVDIFDRESVFIFEILIPRVLSRFPALRVVMEHITTQEAVWFIEDNHDNNNKYKIGATVTPQHLMYDRNEIFKGGLNPHLYCLPILKRRQSQLALRELVCHKNPGNVFLGTDSAPHMRHLKESACGCAGVFSSPVAISCYLSVFEEEDALDKFEAFASLNGPKFYELPVNNKIVTYIKEEQRVGSRYYLKSMGEQLVPLLAGQTSKWQLKEAS